MSGVYVYIDGYNFYCGINQPGWLKYGWCNFVHLANRLTRAAFGPAQSVGKVTYFTAPVRLGLENTAGERERQEMWLDAITFETPTVQVVEGRWQRIGSGPRREKETDVNLAIGMQGQIGEFDGAILVSADSDLIPAIRAVRKAGKPVAVFFPPNQRGYKMPEDLPIRTAWISKEVLAECRMRDVIPRAGQPPISWYSYLNSRKSAGLRAD